MIPLNNHLQKLQRCSINLSVYSINFHPKPRSHYLAVILNLMNPFTFQSTFPHSHFHLISHRLICFSTWSLCLTFPPLPASPPAPVCAPPAGLPGPLCWTSGSPLDETFCSSGLCSAEVTKTEEVS